MSLRSTIDNPRLTIRSIPSLRAASVARIWCGDRRGKCNYATVLDAVLQTVNFVIVGGSAVPFGGRSDVRFFAIRRRSQPVRVLLLSAVDAPCAGEPGLVGASNYTGGVAFPLDYEFVSVLRADHFILAEYRLCARRKIFHPDRPAKFDRRSVSSEPQPVTRCRVVCFRGYRPLLAQADGI